MLRSPVTVALGLAAACMVVATARAEPPAFNRDVRPILADKCFRCHGPDSASRQADLRLDRSDDALRVLTPERPSESELLRRLDADESERMPPPSSGLELTAAESRVLREWVATGAIYEPHWSFSAPRSPPLPTARSGWGRNAIDRFVVAELERRGLEPSPPAPAETQLRRLALALTGLPPEPVELERFLADPSPEAYERAADRWLASPRHAERLALEWLDASRYADTHGYFTDAPRQAWPWRDWVLRAFLDNKPFDEFTVEQLAGDLLPDATREQRLATAFQRNHLVTDESGVIDEEYRVSYVADRLETTATIWLGLTLGCARCHDHKYDPLTQREYYQLFSLFNNVPETGLIKATANAPPTLSLATPEQERRLAEIVAERAGREAQLQELEPELAELERVWLESARLPEAPNDGLVAYLAFEGDVADRGPAARGTRASGELRWSPGVLGQAGTFDATQRIELDAPPLATDRPFSLSVWIKPGGAPIGYILSKIDDTPSQRGFEVLWYKSRPWLNLVREWRRESIELVATETFTSAEWHHLVVCYDGSARAGGIQVHIDGVPQEMSVRRDALQGSVANDAPWLVGWKGAGLGYAGQLDELRLYDRFLSGEEAAALYGHDVLRGAVTAAPDQRLPLHRTRLRERFLLEEGPAEAVALQGELDAWRGREAALRRELPMASVMQELPEPRPTHVLRRGQYDDPGELVAPGFPAALLSSNTSLQPHTGPRLTRLDLARWLVSREHPLTARVTVNRLWQQMFGEGLSRTLNDLGVQGEPPSHPELLDWLAVEFIDSGWDVRRLLRLMVTSETFRQSSDSTPRLLAIDPENRLLARGPRHRLSAESIRDQALSLGGLLVERLGGASVRPYQPPGLWEAVSYNSDQVYVQDRGAGLYRRSLYTYWKRQAPPPELLTLDGPTRETCVVRRARTNTPLQALLLLNDVAFVEASRGLAERMLNESPRDVAGHDEDRLRRGFRWATGRSPSDKELAPLRRLLEDQRGAYRQRGAAAGKLLGVGERSADARHEAAELAAWTLVASVLLNLDETITQH